VRSITLFDTDTDTDAWTFGRHGEPSPAGCRL
jgi:hypothetical protein